MKNIFKKSLLTFLAILIASYSIAVPLAHAQTPPPGPTKQGVGKGQWWFPKYNEFLDKVNQAPPNEIFGERYTHAQVSWIILSLLNIVVGPAAACSEEADFGKCMEAALSQGQDTGALLPLALMTDSLMRTKPVSSIDYVAEKLDRLGIVQTANAQSTGDAGFGFTNSLSIVQGIWRMSRDAAYSLVIFMILVLGFMVMFRAQISPRTVVTVQSALPRVVIGLLLITFSYAIAGLLVDLTFVAQGILSGIVASSDLTSGYTAADEAVNSFNAQQNTLGSIFFLFLAYLVAIFGNVFGAGAGAISFFIGGPLSGALAGIALIIILLLVVVLLIAMVRVFWVMLKTYVIVIMLVAVSPFVFLYGIVKDGINAMWFKQMIANLSVFFTIGAMIIMANILLFATSPNDTFWSGIFNWLASFNFLGINPYHIDTGVVDGAHGMLPGFADFGSVSIVGILVSFALFVSAAKFASSIRDWISSGRVQPGGFGMDAALGGAAGAVGGMAAGGLQREISGKMGGFISKGVGERFSSTLDTVSRLRGKKPLIQSLDSDNPPTR